MKQGYYIDCGKNKPRLTKCITSKAYAEHLFDKKSKQQKGVRLIEMDDIAPRVLRRC